MSARGGVGDAAAARATSALGRPRRRARHARDVSSDLTKACARSSCSVQNVHGINSLRLYRPRGAVLACVPFDCRPLSLMMERRSQQRLSGIHQCRKLLRGVLSIAAVACSLVGGVANAAVYNSHFDPTGPRDVSRVTASSTSTTPAWRTTTSMRRPIAMRSCWGRRSTSTSPPPRRRMDTSCTDRNRHRPSLMSWCRAISWPVSIPTSSARRSPIRARRGSAGRRGGSSGRCPSDEVRGVARPTPSASTPALVSPAIIVG